MLTAKGIQKYYGSLWVLKGVDVKIAKGEIVAIVGPSGSGKSTLLHILGTLDEPAKGEILLQNKRIHDLKGRPLASFRNRHIGFVFQFHHLLPEFSALENVCIPGWIAGRRKKEVEDQALELLNVLGVGHRLVNKPDIVFADEPTGNLDTANAKELHRLFFDLRDRFSQTFLIVTHNEELARMSDRILHMKDGLLINH
jgi:lipoprotein-releasing system ATP-binding protein